MSSVDKSTVLKARMAKYAPYRLNTLIYKLSGGRFMNKTPGGDLKILLLTTTGRKSGKPRTHPVMYYQDGEDFVITATNSGADKPPLWYLNLKVNPQAAVQIGNLIRPVTAHEASGEERTRLWDTMAKLQPVFNAFESFTQRAIPVIVLHSEHQNSTSKTIHPQEA